MLNVLTTNARGELASLKVQTRAIEKGYVVSKPLVSCRYDLVIDDRTKLLRAQVKYAGGQPWRGRTDVIALHLRKWRNQGRSRIPSYLNSEIDLLPVYVPTLDQVLAFGPEIFHERQDLQIRLKPARNNQRKGCFLAADFVW